MSENTPTHTQEIVPITTGRVDLRMALSLPPVAAQPVPRPTMHTLRTAPYAEILPSDSQLTTFSQTTQLTSNSEGPPPLDQQVMSATGMSYPPDSTASQTAVQILVKEGPNTFDEPVSGTRLRPVKFGSRRGTDRDSHFHSSAGEAAAGRWAITQNRHYFWDTHFYWVCDCTALQEGLEYDGDIHQVDG